MKAMLHYKEYTEEDIAMVQMRLENGALAHSVCQFRRRRPCRRPVDGDGQGDRHRAAARATAIATTSRSSPGWSTRKRTRRTQGSIMNEVRHFLRTASAGAKPPLSTMEDAITAQKMIEAARSRSARGAW